MNPGDGSFEEPLAELRRRIEELEGYPEGAGREREIKELRTQLRRDTEAVYARLGRWQ